MSERLDYKERLEDILNDLPGTIRHSGELEPLKQYARGLSKQVIELEEIIEQDHRQGVIEGLYYENKRLKRTLDYYADERIYDAQYKLDIMRDTGKYARKTLKEIEE